MYMKRFIEVLPELKAIANANGVKLSNLRHFNAIVKLYNETHS